MWSIVSNQQVFLVGMLGAVACLLALVLTPVCRNVSISLGLFDHPDDFRKLHPHLIPRVGGTALLLAYSASLVGVCVTRAPLRSIIGSIVSRNGFLLAAVILIFLVGLADDLRGLRPLYKLLGQVAAAILACLNGVSIHLFHNTAVDQWISPLITTGWLVVSTNAFNLIDGLDGLAAGVGFFATVAIAAAAVRDHNGMLLLVSVPLAGALLGFLRYNFNPASIFLGDCGSLSIGFLLGCFGAMWGEKVTTLVGLSAPVMALSLPLAETGVTILRRLLRNRPIFEGDREHIHHRLLDQGNSVKKTVVLLYGACAISATFSLLQQAINKQYGELVFIGYLFILVVGVKQLKYAEFSFSRQLLVKGAISHLIRDQILLHSLNNQLRTTTSLAAAIELARPVCVHFGFTEVLATSLPREPLSPRVNSLWCEISIAISGDRVLLLRGAPQGAQTFGLDQLLRTISGWLRDYGATTAGASGSFVTRRDSFLPSRQVKLAAAAQENG